MSVSLQCKDGRKWDGQDTKPKREDCKPYLAFLGSRQLHRVWGTGLAADWLVLMYTYASVRRVNTAPEGRFQGKETAWWEIRTVQGECKGRMGSRATERKVSQSPSKEG